MQKPSLERIVSAAKERRVRDWIGDIAALGGAALLAKHLDDLTRRNQSGVRGERKTSNDT